MKPAVIGGLVVLAVAAPLVVAATVASGAGAVLTSGVARRGGAVPAAVAGIPTAYLEDFLASGRRFGVPWAVLAGIYRVECDFGRAPLPGCNPVGTENAAGAQGPGQFLPTTWRAGLTPHELIPPGPPTASVDEGFATDGDGDGIADPWDPADAVAATARMLRADGAARDLPRAIWAYDHSSGYVERVLGLARAYSAAAGPGGAREGVAAAAVVAFARSQLGAPYRWGGASPAGWDCSGLVMAAFARVGVALPHNAELQYEDTAAEAVPLDRVEPGDLVFFGPNRAAIGHVGIVVGAATMIDAPHTGAVVRMEPLAWPDLVAATRPLAAPAAGRAAAAQLPRREARTARVTPAGAFTSSHIWVEEPSSQVSTATACHPPGRVIVIDRANRAPGTWTVCPPLIA